MQQYNKFFIASAAVLGEVAGILTPLLEHYQMDERQFMEMMRLDARPVKDGASVPPVSKSKRDSPPPSPKPTKAPTPAPAPSRNAPSSPPLPREAPREASNGTTAQPKPVSFDDLLNGSAAPEPQRSAPNPPQTPAPAQSSAPPAGPSLIDGWDDIPSSAPSPPASTKPTGPSKSGVNFVDATFDTSPPPTNSSGSSQSSNLFGGDPFDIFGQTPMQPQPVNLKPTPNVSPQPKPAGFNVPPQPQSAYFKSGAPFANGQPQQPQPPPGKGNFYNVPPNFGPKPAPTPGFSGMPGGFGTQPPPAAGFGGMPSGFGAQPPPGAGFGPQPFGAAPRPGAGYGFPPGGPGNGAPFSNPPPTTSFFVQETDGLDSTTASKLRLWAEKGGKKQNLRALLTTMHEVLWPDSGWEPKGPGELIAPGNVKKAYRQATLIVHPDRVASCTEEQKIMAKRIFEYLSESYEVFKNEP